jgi:RNA polymerase sigma-70 factor (ECF subfamily)
MEHISQDCFEALQRGDEQACNRTFRHYRGFALHVARRCGMDEQIAEDIVQVAFLRLSRHAPGLEKPNTIAQWLAVTIRNLCLDEFRKSIRSSRTLQNFVRHQETFQSESTEPSVDDKFDGRIYAETIRTLNNIPGGETLKAFYLEGHSVEEIAQKNQEAIGTVTARLSRMRKKLRDILLKKISQWEEV